MTLFQDVQEIIDLTAIEAAAEAARPLLADKMALEDLINVKNRRLFAWRIVGISGIGAAVIVSIFSIARR